MRAMYEIEFQQRRRQMLTRWGVALLLCLVGLISVLPRANAHDTASLSVAELSSKDYLLSPEPMSSARFGALVAPAQRGLVR